MKSFKITKANFTPAGNAYFVDKQRNSYFVSKALLEQNNLKAVTDIKFPVYVNIGAFTYNNIDENKKPIINADGTNSTFTREDVIDIFPTAQLLADDFADDLSIEVLKMQAVKALGTTAGLDENSVNKLASMSI